MCVGGGGGGWVGVFARIIVKYLFWHVMFLFHSLLDSNDVFSSFVEFCSHPFQQARPLALLDVIPVHPQQFQSNCVHFSFNISFLSVIKLF